MLPNWRLSATWWFLGSLLLFLFCGEHGDIASLPQALLSKKQQKKNATISQGKDLTEYLTASILQGDADNDVCS